MLKIVSHGPKKGWMKVPQAAKAARIPIFRMNGLIVSGAVPVAIDGAGYMWTSAELLRNGTTSGNKTIQNQ